MAAGTLLTQLAIPPYEPPAAGQRRGGKPTVTADKLQGTGCSASQATNKELQMQRRSWRGAEGPEY